MLRKMLAKDKSERLLDARAVLRALDALDTMALAATIAKGDSAPRSGLAGAAEQHLICVLMATPLLSAAGSSLESAIAEEPLAELRRELAFVAAEEGPAAVGLERTGAELLGRAPADAGKLCCVIVALGAEAHAARDSSAAAVDRESARHGATLTDCSPVAPSPGARASQARLLARRVAFASLPPWDDHLIFASHPPHPRRPQRHPGRSGREAKYRRQLQSPDLLLRHAPPRGLATLWDRASAGPAQALLVAPAIASRIHTARPSW